MQTEQKKNKKDTKQLLLCHAKKEFIEKGFMKASLRTICKNAGVTTGALYFFFQDKNALFAELVRTPLENINTILLMHYQTEKLRLRKNPTDLRNFDSSKAVCFRILHELYTYREEFLLLLTKAQGSHLENISNSFSAILYKRNRMLADTVAASNQTHSPLSDDAINGISHIQVNVFLYMIDQFSTEEEASIYLEQIFPFLEHGWCGILRLHP